MQLFLKCLKKKNIPAELKEGKSIFEIMSSNVLYYYMKLLINPELHSDKFFKLILSRPFNIHPKVTRLFHSKKSHYKSFVDMIKNSDKTDFIEPEKIENLSNF